MLSDSSLSLKSVNLQMFSLLEECFRETVIRFRLRLLLISEFILVLPLPLLACPYRVITQFFMLPLTIWGLLVRMQKGIFVWEV
jgi:hypothetical protein